MPNPGPGQPSSTSYLSGTVTDIDGSPIIGASVRTNGQATTTTQSGDYVLPSITVPANQNSLVATVTASKVIGGRTWSGQNQFEVLSGEPNASNVHVTLSDEATQAALSGVVRDQSQNPLPGARVFVSAGPIVHDPKTGAQSFTNLKSFTVYADQNGAYTIPRLPTLTAGNPPVPQAYTASASFAGHQNDTVALASLTAGTTAQHDFRLVAGGGSPKLGTPANFAVSTFTVPMTANRSTDTSGLTHAYAAIRDYLLTKRGLTGHRFADLRKTTLHRAVRRSTPAGSLIESDLFWDYQTFGNLYGYDIVRSPTDDRHYVSIATLRDPLGDRFSDLDPALTPDAVYFYSLARLDTINFPNNDTSSESDPAAEVQVSPLNQISLVSPAANASVGAQPTLSWGAVNGAGSYVILLYNHYPDYPSDTAGVVPFISPFAVDAPATSATVPSALPSGTYYWVVLAEYIPPANRPDVGAAYSVSQISKFIVP